MKRWSEMLARIKIAPKHVLRLEEATGNGRYLMIGAAEHGFIDSQRGLALICEKRPAPASAWRAAGRIHVAQSTLTSSFATLPNCISASRLSIWSTAWAAMRE